VRNVMHDSTSMEHILWKLRRLEVMMRQMQGQCIQHKARRVPYVVACPSFVGFGTTPVTTIKKNILTNEVISNKIK
jgi:hypothetical protein